MKHSAQKTILVVDDEVDLCEIIQFDLEDQGYRVLTAHRVADALDIVLKQTVDLVISDIRMPGADGLHLLSVLRQQHYENPPVIFITGFADLTLADAYHKGVVGFMAKPLSLEELFQAVRDNLKDTIVRWTERPEPAAQRQFKRAFASLHRAEEQGAMLLGRGGFFLQMSEELPKVDELLHVSLRLEEEGLTLEGWAQCRWIRLGSGPRQPRGAGLEWLKLEEGAAAFLSKRLKELQRVPFIPALAPH